MYKNWSLILIVYMAFHACDKKNKEPVFLEDNLKTPDEMYLVDLSKKILKNQFKEAKVEKTSQGIHLFLEFGGTSALSFRTQDTFEREMQLTTAFFALKTIRLSSKRNLTQLTMSVVKPFYVREETIKKEVIEEFEIFRVSLDPLQVKQLDKFNGVNIETLSLEGSEGEVQLEVLNSIIKNWKVELNEIYRVEIK